MKVNKIVEYATGFDKSYVIVEHLNGRIQKINLRRDKKRFNIGNHGNQYYFLDGSNRICLNEITVHSTWKSEFI